MAGSTSRNLFSIKLESFNILAIPENVVSKVVDTVDATTKMGIKVRWIDKVLRVIGTKRDLLHPTPRSSTAETWARGTSERDG